jgi:CubicO group peptidase (beta-lactamase class C family)
MPLFAIASMTKPVTIVAGLLLWEEGRIGLADPICLTPTGLSPAGTRQLRLAH